ncbi:LysR family transcriptional regulator [Agrobacterium salinitolerans]|uniref:LysR family transcriptional regulator n=1 Tax=Agrobacterium salinitolerans TaxID=1183413 RepID=A0ABY3BIX1_9HYPH|nr:MULTISPECIES: LysR family transcriptional regulator [Agrobacterium]MCZ7893968.1 LysR family transcriptional regulator [Agrobacterium salinitolerans]TRA84257.1 LysR family transcriptional regulator [Agrobacterium salinitolerans]
MELRQLRHFQVVAETGSFTRAAALLNVAQPALSRDIRLLELGLATKLFHRHGRGVVLTTEGATFLTAIVPNLEGLDRARKDIVEHGADPHGVVRLGWTGVISVPLGAQIITRFKEDFPNVELQTLGGSSSQIQEWINDSRIDLGVMNSERPAHGSHQEHLMSAELFHVCRAQSDDDGSTTLQTISFREAASHSLLLHGRHHALRRAIDIAAKRHEIDLKVIAQIDEFAAVKQLIYQGGGTTILPLGLLHDVRDDPRLSVRRITQPTITLYSCTLFPRSPINYIVSELAKIIRRETLKAISAQILDGCA